jgi:dienelactone hydrolase
LQKLLGKLPPRPLSPVVQVVSREDMGDYVQEKFTFDNGAGAMVSGYVFLPKGGATQHPAILYNHWHGGEYAIGKEELLQARHTPEAPGPTLARRGFVVLGIDACCFGERSGKGPDGPGQKGGAEEMSSSKFNLWHGRTLWGMIVRDDLIALDILCARPDVDPSRIGVTGISMGSTRSWWVMAMDDRPRTMVGVCCLTRYQDLIRKQALYAHGIYYFVPGMLRHFDAEAVVALSAPRPVLFLSGETDIGSPVEGIAAIEKAVKPVYALHGAEADYQSIVYPGVGHEYTPDMWKRMIEWMETRLQAKP